MELTEPKLNINGLFTEYKQYEEAGEEIDDIMNNGQPEEEVGHMYD